MYLAEPDLLLPPLGQRSMETMDTASATKANRTCAAAKIPSGGARNIAITQAWRRFISVDARAMMRKPSE